MRTERRAAALALLLIGLAALAVSVLLIIPWVVQAQAREVTPTTGATGTNPPAQPTNLQASAEHDSVTLTWQASTDQTVTHYAILRRHPDTDASQVFHVIESNAGPETGYTDGSVSASSTYIYRVKAVSPTGVSQWSGYVKADTPAAPDTTLEPTSTPTPTPDPTPAPEDLRPTGLTVSLVENRVTLSWAAPKEDADSVTGYEILRRRPTEGESTLATLVADTESTATTYTDATANEASVRYVYRVKALRGSEASLWSNFDRIDLPSDYVPDPPPTSEPESTPDDQAPTGLTAALAQGGGVALSWTAPAEVADSVTGYEVLRAAGEGELSTLAADTGNTATAYTDTTATEAGETYAYQVKAIRGEERSQASGQARVQLPQDAVDLAPSNLTAEAVDSGVNLSWTAPAEDADSVTGYEVLRAVGEGELATLAADTGSTTTSYTDATATEAGETYAYQVKAIRGEDRSQSSNRVALIPVEPPATPETLAPSNLTFEIREHGVTLAWDAPAAAADSVTGYRVVRRRPNQGENEWLVWKWDTGSTETTYRDGHAQTHGEYYIFRVRALRGDDYSKMSNFVQVTRPEAAPETTEWAPSNLQGQIYVEVALGEEESTTQVKLSWDAPAEGTEWVRGYEVQRAACDGDFTALAADTGSTATGYTDADVEAGESYTYRVRARRPQGKSLWTNWWTVLIPGGSGEGACGIAAGATGTPATPEEGENYALSAQVQVNAYLTPATLLNTLLGYDEAEGTGTLAPNELTFDEGATFRVTSVNTWPGFPGLVLMLTADSSAQDAALADRDFILEADETVLVVGTTEFSFDDALGTHSETTGDNGEYTGVVIVTWTEGESGLVAGETVDFRLVLRDRPEEAQFTQHDTEVTLVKNTGQTADGTAVKLVSPANPKTPEVVHRRRVAQQFTTGTSAAGYVLGSIGIDFDTIANSSTAGAALKVTLNEEGLLVESGIPGRVLCTLSDPATFTGSGLHTFDAPETCPKLEPGRNYLVVVRRDNFAGGTISLKVTTSAGEDTGSAALSSISDRRTWLLTRRALYNSEIFIDVGWRQVDSESHLIEVRASTVVIDEEALLNKHFNTLNAAGNDYPLGIWSDGTTMWVADLLDSKIYAYNMATKARDADKDFNTLAAAGNNEPRGLWSDGSTMWVSDYYDEKLYAYNLQTKVRVPSEDFNNLFRSNQQVGPLAEPFGIWSDGNTMWVADHGDHKIYAYDMVHKGRKASRDFDTLDALPGRLTTPGGIWADETTMFVTNRLAGGRKDRILAYWRYTTSPQPGRFITVAAQNNIVSGIWSDGNTMWVSDEGDAKIYAYRLPDPQERPAGDLVSLEHVTDTTAMVKVDIEQLVLVYGTVEPTVSVKILGTYSSATMYVHPEGGYARFLLMGLRPETQYTLEVSYGISNPHKPNAGRKIFRTDYARLGRHRDLGPDPHGGHGHGLPARRGPG